MPLLNGDSTASTTSDSSKSDITQSNNTNPNNTNNTNKTNKRSAQNRIRSICLAGLGIALLAVAAQIQLPIGPVPFTLQSMIIVIILLVYTPSESLAAISGYLLMGAIGLPVGAGFKGGLAWLVGPTGGFLIGFLVAALCVIALRQLLQARMQTTRAAVVLDFCLATIVLLVFYSLGSAWFMVSTGATLTATLLACVLPFLVPDVIKAVVALSCAQAIRLALGRSPLPKKQERLA